MKKNFMIAGLVLAAALVSCEKNIDQNLEPKDSIRLEATFAPDSRTTLDGLSCTWSSGDAIVVNGETSTSIEIATGGKSAVFTLPVVDAPYYGIYPASAYVASSFDPNNGQYGSVTVPASQTWTANSFDPAAAIMVGKSEDGSGIAFKHAMAYLKFNITAGGEDTDPIKEIKISAIGGENLSGTFTFDGDDSINNSGTDGNFVAIDCGTSGAALGTPIIVAIPAKRYASGLNIRISDVNNHYQALKSTSAFDAEPGVIYPTDISYKPAGTIIDGGIYTVSDWNDFAEAVTAGDDFAGQTITLMADLEVEGTFTQAEGTFNGTFEGNNHSFTAAGHKHPLFTTIGTNGTVQNVTINGTWATPDDAGSVGNATIARINLGTIQDCVNNSSINIEGYKYSFVLGTICTQNGGQLIRCINNGDITIKLNLEAISGFYGGGIAAFGQAVFDNVSSLTPTADWKPGKFTACENHGNIYAEAASPSGKFGVKNAIGGICGQVYMDGVVFEDCVNSGDISRVSIAGGTGEGSTNKSTTVGGILGRSCAWVGGNSEALVVTGDYGYNTQIINCSNSGTVKIYCRDNGGCIVTDSGARFDYAGGIVGAITGKAGTISKVEGCSNTGKIQGGWTDTGTNTSCIAGIAGLAIYTDFTSCTAENCTLESVDPKPNSVIGAAGGIVAVAMSNVKLTSCNAKPIININKTTNVNRSCAPGLLIGFVKAGGTATFTTCKAGGSITVDGTSLGVSSGNFQNFVVSSTPTASPVIPSTTSVTWY